MVQKLFLTICYATNGEHTGEGASLYFLAAYTSDNKQTLKQVPYSSQVLPGKIDLLATDISYIGIPLVFTQGCHLGEQKRRQE